MLTPLIFGNGTLKFYFLVSSRFLGWRQPQHFFDRWKNLQTFRMLNICLTILLTNHKRTQYQQCMSYHVRFILVAAPYLLIRKLSFLWLTMCWHHYSIYLIIVFSLILMQYQNGFQAPRYL